MTGEREWNSLPESLVTHDELDPNPNTVDFGEIRLLCLFVESQLTGDGTNSPHYLWA